MQSLVHFYFSFQTRQNAELHFYLPVTTKKTKNDND